MRKVKPNDVHTGVDQAPEHLFAFACWTDRCDNLCSFCGSSHGTHSVPWFSGPSNSRVGGWMWPYSRFEGPTARPEIRMRRMELMRPIDLISPINPISAMAPELGNYQSPTLSGAKAVPLQCCRSHGSAKISIIAPARRACRVQVRTL